MKCPCKNCFFGYICDNGKSVWCEISESRFDVRNDSHCSRYEQETEERRIHKYKSAEATN